MRNPSYGVMIRGYWVLGVAVWILVSGVEGRDYCSFSLEVITRRS